MHAPDAAEGGAFEEEMDEGSSVPMVDAASSEEIQRRHREDQVEAALMAESPYTADHLAAVIRPVALTMVLASLAVVFVRDKDTDAAISGGLSVYLVYDETTDPGGDAGTDGGGGGGGGSGGGGTPSSQQAGEALINALVIVGVICVATFGLVACYYFRCLKLLAAYLVFAMTMLLGYSGMFVVMTAIQRYQVIFDYPSLFFLMWNFGIVGAFAIFYQKGLPRALAQGYLIMVSVIMAWILSKFPEWTSWALLVMLALYDLCAVLTPCGPLRALINLAQERRDPIPGLLYEAEVRSQGANGGSGGNNHYLPQSDDRVRDTFVTQSRAPGGSNGSTAETRPASAASVDSREVRVSAQRDSGTSRANAEAGGVSPLTSAIAGAPAATPVPLAGNDTPQPDAEAGNSGAAVPAGRAGAGAGVARQPEAQGGSVEQPTAADELVEMLGGITGDVGADGGPGDEQESQSVKLGLGDFVFYSVLVSRAALTGFPTFAAAFIAIIMGLAGTLLLLAVFRMALPALPISIFLGVTFTFVTRYVVDPFLVDVVFAGLAL